MISSKPVPGFDLIDEKRRADEIARDEKIEKVEQYLKPVYDPKVPFKKQFSAFIKGETHAGRTVGSVIDFAQIFLPGGVKTARDAAKLIVNRKQKQTDDMEKVKEWIKQPSSKAGMAILMAILGIFGVQIEPELLGEHINTLITGICAVIGSAAGIYDIFRKERQSDKEELRS